MAKVEFTPHLYQFFPDLQGQEHVVEASTVAEVVREMDRVAPGLAFYVCDERGRLRRHVNLFIDGRMLSDRKRLSDAVERDSRVLIMQALSGG